MFITGKRSKLETKEDGLEERTNKNYGSYVTLTLYNTNFLDEKVITISTC